MLRFGLLVLCVAGCESEQTPESVPFPGFDYQEGYLRGCSTDRLWVNTWTSEAPAEATLVLANGRTDFTDMFHHVVPLLERNWNVVMFDQYGQGRSGGIRAHAVDMEAQHVCDLDVVIDRLAPRDTPLLLASHSTGGLQATRWQQLNPGVATAAVHNAPLYEFFHPTYTHEAICQQSELYAPSASTEPNDPNWARTECETNVDFTHDCELYDEWILHDLSVEVGASTWGWNTAVCSLIEETFSDAMRISEPVLILQAGLDTSVVNAAHLRLCDQINDARPETCTVELYAENYHHQFLETNRSDVVGRMVAFFDKALAEDTQEAFLVFEGHRWEPLNGSPLASQSPDWCEEALDADYPGWTADAVSCQQCLDIAYDGTYSWDYAATLVTTAGTSELYGSLRGGQWTDEGPSEAFASLHGRMYSLDDSRWVVYAESASDAHQPHSPRRAFASGQSFELLPCGFTAPSDDP